MSVGLIEQWKYVREVVIPAAIEKSLRDDPVVDEFPPKRNDMRSQAPLTSSEQLITADMESYLENLERKEENKKRIKESAWIETFTGKKFNFLDPQPEDICIEDIAHSLAMLCRFTGHCRYFYSVAEHSVAVSRLCSVRNDLAGLLHDSAEAYINDLSSPLKKLNPDYKKIENRILEVIADKFHIKFPFVEEIKDADFIQLSIESLHLLPSKGEGWHSFNGKRPEGGIEPLGFSPEDAEKMFIEEYRNKC